MSHLAHNKQIKVYTCIHSRLTNNKLPACSGHCGDREHPRVFVCLLQLWPGLGQDCIGAEERITSQHPPSLSLSSPAPHAYRAQSLSVSVRISEHREAAALSHMFRGQQIHSQSIQRQQICREAFY